MKRKFPLQSSRYESIREKKNLVVQGFSPA